MPEQIKLIQIAVGSSMEFCRYEGDRETALKILMPYGEVQSPAVQRVDRVQHARLVAERLKPARFTFAPLPESLTDANYRPMQFTRAIGWIANL